MADDLPPPERQSRLINRDSALMRRSDAHECRQAYNAQAVVCAHGTQLMLATDLVAATADPPSFAPTVLGREVMIGLPSTVLADTGYANRAMVAAVQRWASSRWWRLAPHRDDELKISVFHRQSGRRSGSPNPRVSR